MYFEYFTYDVVKTTGYFQMNVQRAKRYNSAKTKNEEKNIDVRRKRFFFIKFVGLNHIQF